jgi:hypothetical protein
MLHLDTYASRSRLHVMNSAVTTISVSRRNDSAGQVLAQTVAVSSTTSACIPQG